MQEMQETQVRSLGWEDPLGEEMAITPVFLLGKSHGQKSLVGYSPQGRKESDTTEHTPSVWSFILKKKSALSRISEVNTAFNRWWPLSRTF